MDILKRIVADKRQEVERKRHLIPESHLERSPLFQRATHSLVDAVRATPSGIIAEFKRRSPSKSVINQESGVDTVAAGYAAAGAAAMSVLTDGKYFGGSLDDLVSARASTSLPLLRKDFTVDEYQIIEAKAHGADAVLLIAAVLGPDEITGLAARAYSLGLEVLLEVHDGAELDRSLGPDIHLVGVNNRNLKTFEVDIETSIALAERIPKEAAGISESGIRDPETVRTLIAHGFDGFLVGERFMREVDPGAAAGAFIQSLGPWN